MGIDLILVSIVETFVGNHLDTSFILCFANRLKERNSGMSPYN